MASVPISDLPSATALAIANVIVVNQSGVTKQSTVGAVSTALQVEVSITQYGATDSADIATALAAVVTAYPNGCTILFPETTNHWLLSSQFATSDSVPYILKGRGPASKVKKGFNGAMISLGKRSQMENMYLDGDGATYTGVGVTITSGSNDATSWRTINNCDIHDMASYGVEFSGNRAGYGSSISECRIIPRTVTVAAIKLPTLGTTESNGNRSIVNCLTGSNSLCEVADAVNTVISDCDGGVPTMNANASKISISGCRLVSWAGAATWTLTGGLHSIVGNTISLTAGTNSITFAAGLTGTKYVGNSSSTATISDSATGASNGNEIFYGQQTYTTTWTGSAVNPDLGDGTKTSTYTRVGDLCYFDIQITMGSTTTYGTGYWEFSIPFTAHRPGGGTVEVLDAGTAYFTGVVRAETDATRCVLISNGAANFFTSAIPHTWANTDTLYISGWYYIK